MWIKTFLAFVINFSLVLILNAQSVTPIDATLQRIQQATVFVYQAVETSSDFLITCVGSGTLVSRDGLILTNAHNSIESPECPGDTLIIALSIRLDEPPVPLYRANVVQVDNGLDLALLRINRNLDGRLLDRQDLVLPFVSLGDSSLLSLDDTITIVGYPDIDESSVSVVTGTLTAFISEPTNQEASWLKTSASIPALMSGAGAYNSNGELIGVPTTIISADVSNQGTCRVIQDTNNDGLVNNNDICVPIGGFINALRPSNFARSLFRAASLGLSVDLDVTQSNQQIQDRIVVGDPEINRLFFSTSVNNANMPTTIVNSVPTGTNSLYLFFDYRNIPREAVYEVRISTDGVPNAIFSLAPVRWNGGERGLWYIGIRGQTWRNGIYDFTIFVNGVAQNTASIVVGGGPTDLPVISDVVFGLSDLDGTPLGNGYVLPAGTTASARFVYRNMTQGTPWLTRWFYEGGEIFRAPPDTWQDGTDGAKTISIQDASGLLPGRYRLEIYIEGRLAATSDFTIAGTAEGAFPQVFTDAYFASAPSTEEALTTPAGTNFVTNIERLFVLFDWQQITPGTNWTIRWFVDNQLFFEETLRWGADLRGENYVLQLSSPDGLPDATYRIELLIGNVRLAETEAQIGIGQLPIDRFANTAGIRLQGKILDHDTKQGIPGVTFLLISEDFSVADFVWDSQQVYASGTTDRNGDFQVDQLLAISTDARTVPYSVVISAEGYLPIQVDGFVVDNETPNPLDLTIYLKKGET